MRIDTSRFPGRKVIWVEKTGSTMADAAGHPPGTVVVADEQTAGQGRHGHQWHSEPATGLYFSTVESLPCPVPDLPVVTLAMGLAVQDGIQRVCNVLCDIRWPNDLLLGGRKCAGILVHLDKHKIIGGIGINVNQSAFPDGISAIATSLKIHTGEEHPREEILAAVLEAGQYFLEILRSEGKTAILRQFSQSSSYVFGRRVAVDTEEATLTGNTDGLDDSGFLWVRTDDGRRHLIRAGGVRPA